MLIILPYLMFSQSSGVGIHTTTHFAENKMEIQETCTHLLAIGMLHS